MNRAVATMMCLASLILVTGCASGPPLGREKAGATYEEFAQARYGCMKEAASQYSGATVNAYGGAATTEQVIGCQMYDACMQSKGFVLVSGGRFNAPVMCRQ